MQQIKQQRSLRLRAAVVGLHAEVRRAPHGTIYNKLYQNQCSAVCHFNLFNNKQIQIEGEF